MNLDALQEITRGDAQCVRQLGDRRDARVALSGFEEGDGVAVHPRALSKRFLREAGLLSGSP